MRPSLAVLAVAATLSACASRRAAAPKAAAPQPAASAAVPAASPSDELRRLAARELPARPAQPFTTSAGISGRVETAASPQVGRDADVDVVTVPLGTAEPIVCSIHPTALDPAATIWRMAELAKQNVKLVSVVPVDVLEVKGSALVLAEVVYQVDRGGGPLVGEMKLAVYAHRTTSLLCRHDELGYRATFTRVVKDLAGSLSGGEPDPRAAAVFAELSVWRVGPLVVGYGERAIWRTERGGRRIEQATAALLPRGPADVLAVDTSSREFLDPKDLVVEGVYAQGTNGEVDTTMKISRAADGLTYAYDGKKDGKELKGRFKTHAGLSSELWFARRLARAVAPKVPQRKPRERLELVHQAYAVTANPVAPQPITIRLDPATPGRATMELGPMKTTGELDASGLFSSTELPVGPATLVATRVFSRGAP
jgi:hypothetical protein